MRRLSHSSVRFPRGKFNFPYSPIRTNKTYREIKNMANYSKAPSRRSTRATGLLAGPRIGFSH